MADSFFGFNTSLRAFELDDGPELDEEEYDALNNETFGDNAFQGDWEEDHTRFAEVTESSRVYRNSFNSDKDDDLDFEATISQLVLEDCEEEEEEEEDDVKNKSSKSISIIDNYKSDPKQIYCSSPIWSIDTKKNATSLTKQVQQSLDPSASKYSAMQFLPPQIPKIPTVQELERDLMQRNKQNQTLAKDVKGSNLNYVLNQGRNVTQPPPLSTLNSGFVQQNLKTKFTYTTGNNKIPPGFIAPQRAPFLQPPQQEMVLFRNNMNMPMMLGPRLLPPYILPNPHLLLTPNPRLVPPHMMRFLPPHPVLLQPQQQQHHMQQLQLLHQNKVLNRPNQFQLEAKENVARCTSGNNDCGRILLQNPDRRGGGDFDEYAGLMNTKERLWLRNIQLIQLTTDKPHIDDYYYMQWLKKQENKVKTKEQTNQTKNGMKKEKDKHNKQNNRDRKDSERDLLSAPTPRTYVPLQFENSLGKLQCLSVTAPRILIDLDVVSEPQAEVAPVTTHRDARKTKKLLLELERLYLMALEIEEMDAKVSSTAVPAPCKTEEPQLTKPELLEKVMSSFLNENRFVNFMCIRKGKNLLIRILQHLSVVDHTDQLSDLWYRTVKSLATIIRKDHNDGLLLLMYPYFKKWISTTTYGKLSSLASLLLPGNGVQAVKSSPRTVSPNSVKSVLSVSLASKFGVSVVSSILSHGEHIFPELEDKDQLDWTTFLFNFMKQMTNVPSLENIPAPLEPLAAEVVSSILNKSTGLHIQDYASAKRILNCFQ